MKILMFIVISYTLALNGCATIGSYSVSESDLEGYFHNAVADFDREQLKSGSPLRVSLNDVDIEVGPDNRDVIQLAIEGEIAVNAVLIELPVKVAVSIEGAPVYQSKNNAIYVRRLKLLDSHVEAPFLSGKNELITDKFMAVLAKILETVPVYQLDESDFQQRLIASVPMDVKVAKGKLVFVPAEQ